MEKIVTWFDDLFTRMHLEPYLNKVGLTTNRLANGVVFFGTAFGLGFFFKRYFKFLIAWVFVTALIYWILRYNNLISIDFAGVKEFLGLSSIEQTGMESTMQMLWMWMKENIFLVVSAAFGFFFGYTLG